MPESPAPCPAPDVLEGIAAGHVASLAVHEHLTGCGACQARLQQIREDNRFLTGFVVDGALPTVPLAEPSVTIDIPGYQIMGEIHRGGQGLVYLAVQRSTKRNVAVKVMKHGPFATSADRARFDREIETLGRLDHPNIVAVYDAGTAAGFQYFVMDYVEGCPLDETFPGAETAGPDGWSPDLIESHPGRGLGHPRGRRPMRIAAALDVFIKVCDAVHAAHLRGVIHRDLKPSNIRVDQSGEPHVLDFGLAKSTESQVESGMTQTGQFIGSLPWASPEQVEGVSEQVDLRTDVYSLGAILFQLLTGAVPFDIGSSLRQAVHSILFRAPPRPSAVAASAGRPRIDDELDTIVLKCLAKDRDDRYQSAGELARDLRRYLAGEPIEAKRDSALYVLGKTLRRYRYRVATVGLFVVLLAVFGFSMAVLYRRSAHLEQDAVRSAHLLAGLLAQSNLEQGRMAGLLGNMESAEQLLWGELLTHRDPGEEGAVHLNDPPGPPEVYWALSELYRRYPCLRTFTPEPASAYWAVLSDDGDGLWTTDASGLVQKLDAWGTPLDSYRAVPTTVPGALYIDATRNVILAYAANRCELWRRGADRPLLELPRLKDPEAGGFAVSRSGRRCAALIEETAYVWDLDPVEEIARLSSGTTGLTAVALSNDGGRLAARDRAGGLHVWDLASKREVRAVGDAVPARGALHQSGELLFSPDDQMLADAWMEIPGRIWDLRSDPPSPIELSERPGDIRRQSFSPDGHLLAMGDLNGAVRVFDTATGRRLKTLVAHPGRVRSVVFAADGRGLWTSGEGTLRLWEVAADAHVQVVRMEGEAFHGVDISPGGAWYAAGGGLGMLHRIDPATLEVSSVAVHNAPTISCVAISPDGRRTAAATYDNAVYVWDAQHGGETPHILAHPQRVSYVCFTSDSGRIASACDDGVVRIWRAEDGRLERELSDGVTRVPQVAFDPSGARLAAAARDGTLLLWNVESGECETWCPATQNPLRAVRFSFDGRWLVVAGADRTVDIWDTSSRQRSARLVGHNQEIFCLDVSSNQELLASGDTGGPIRLWHAGLRRPLATLEGHTGPVMSLRFAPDGRSLLSASLDGTLRVWNLTYYDKHIAGNLPVQLRRLGADKVDQATANAWRRAFGARSPAVVEQDLRANR